MFFKRRKHPLPRFPDTVIPMFKQLCSAVPEEKAKALAPEINQCVEKFQKHSEAHQAMNLSLAYKIADQCKFLLDIYGERSEKEQSLIMGAVRYFAFADDPFSEKDFATGFDDDARIVNYVLEELGIPGRYIDIR